MYNVVLNNNTKKNCTIKFTFKFKVHVNYVLDILKLKLLLRHWI